MLQNPKTALAQSARALRFSSEAFFHPDMLGMLYFPPEHTYAVYLPLFAPGLMPLVVALLKELRAWREERRSKAKRKIE
jgi:phosphatidylinositol glycan class S